MKDKYLSTAHSAAEMIRKGCTACYDLSAEFPLPSAEGISAKSVAKFVGMFCAGHPVRRNLDVVCES